MVVVRAESFGCGSLADVVETSLVLAAEPNRHDFLVGVSDQGKFAIAINDAGGYRAFECSGNTPHSGIIIPNLIFEIDLSSPAEPYAMPAGAMLRSSQNLLMATATERFSTGAIGPVTLLGGLPSSPSGAAISFPNWTISIQDGPSRVRLYSSESGREVGV